MVKYRSTRPILRGRKVEDIMRKILLIIKLITLTTIFLRELFKYKVKKNDTDKTLNRKKKNY